MLPKIHRYRELGEPRSSGNGIYGGPGGSIEWLRFTVAKRWIYEIGRRSMNTAQSISS